MTIANTKASNVFNANGVTRDFALGFVYDENVSGISIKVIDSEGTETEVTSNYTIYNGVLTYPTVDSGLDPLEAGYKITIERLTPHTQTIDLIQQGPLDAETLEGGYDKLTMEVQELQDASDRSIKFPLQTEGETDAQQYIEDLQDLLAQGTAQAGIATQQAGIATTKASEATASASAAATSAQNAATSESNAASSATAASNSATAAAASEQHTIQNEELLQEYVDQAATSATTAVTNATQAASSATSASASATAASASETSAAASAASASASAETATTKAAEASASAQSAAQSAAVFVVDSALSPTSRNPLENRAIYNELNTLKLVQIVEELPATGDGKSVYGVIQDEMTRDGYPIVQLFCWDVDDELWYAIAAYSIDIDPNGIVYEDSVPYATSTRVGGFKETFSAATGTWTVTTEEL